MASPSVQPPPPSEKEDLVYTILAVANVLKFSPTPLKALQTRLGICMCQLTCFSSLTTWLVRYAHFIDSLVDEVNCRASGPAASSLTKS